MWSINERLGGGVGEAVPRMTEDWIEDLLQVGRLEQEEMDDDEDGGGDDLEDLLDE